MFGRLFAVVFLSSGAFINFLQLILYLFLKPLSKSCYRSVNYYLCYSLYSQIVFITEWWSRSKVEIWIDEDDLKNYVGKEHGLLITNHSCGIDWVVGWIFADKCNMLGNVKAITKKFLAYTPIIGWSWKFSDFIFLDHSYKNSKNVIAKQLKEIYSYPDPVWLALAAEGECCTPDKQEESAKFALRSGIPVLRHLLIPRTKGFVASLPSLRNKCTIYDLNIAFRKDEVTPTLANILSGNGLKAYIFMRRIPMNNVPENGEQAAQWLHEMFREKDKILDSFHTTGSFFKASGFKEPKSFVARPRLSTLINFLGWALVCILLIMYYIVPFLIKDGWFGLSVCIAVPTFYYFLMNKGFRMPRLNSVFSPKEPN